MDSAELFKWLSAQGLGGFIFWFYRQAMEANRQDAETHRLALKDYLDMSVQMVRETTTALNGTTTALNGVTAAIEGLRQDQRTRKAH